MSLTMYMLGSQVKWGRQKMAAHVSMLASIANNYNKMTMVHMHGYNEKKESLETEMKKQKLDVMILYE